MGGGGTHIIKKGDFLDVYAVNYILPMYTELKSIFLLNVMYFDPLILSNHFCAYFINFPPFLHFSTLHLYEQI